MPAENNNAVKQNHSITIDNRNRIVTTGISEVTSYDANAIIAVSAVGDLVIQGSQLHIFSFDQQSGKLSVDGSIDSLQYVSRKSKGDSFFSRMLK